MTCPSTQVIDIGHWSPERVRSSEYSPPMFIPKTGHPFGLFTCMHRAYSESTKFSNFWREFKFKFLAGNQIQFRVEGVDGDRGQVGGHSRVVVVIEFNFDCTSDI